MHRWLRRLGLVFVVVVLCSAMALSKDEEQLKVPEGCMPFLSTADAGRPYEIIALIHFFQPKGTSILGSDAEATIREAMKNLLNKAAELQEVSGKELDAVIGVRVVPLAPSGGGEFGLWVMGTAIQYTD
jgi:hypothetical protein